jgi:hypothetical protein
MAAIGVVDLSHYSFHDWTVEATRFCGTSTLCRHSKRVFGIHQIESFNHWPKANACDSHAIYMPFALRYIEKSVNQAVCCALCC